MLVEMLTLTHESLSVIFKMIWSGELIQMIMLETNSLTRMGGGWLLEFNHRKPCNCMKYIYGIT
ncbi:hypothetical protein HZS_787 [Henneguya salminicola]|nr:hypothetical protein HZS_787 [Henneguya salminicola]